MEEVAHHLKVAGRVGKGPTGYAVEGHRVVLVAAPPYHRTPEISG